MGALLSSFSYQVLGVSAIDGQILPVGSMIPLTSTNFDSTCGQSSVVKVPQTDTDADISEYIFLWFPPQDDDRSTLSALLLR